MGREVSIHAEVMQHQRHAFAVTCVALEYGEKITPALANRAQGVIHLVARYKHETPFQPVSRFDLDQQTRQTRE